jgi:hypothetical protein
VLHLRDGTHGRAGGASCTGDLEASARHSGSSETGETVPCFFSGNIESRDCLVRYRRNGKVLAVASIFRDVDNLKDEAAMEQAG